MKEDMGKNMKDQRNSDLAGSQEKERTREKNLGLRYALAAYGTWGVMPLYWKMIEQVPAVEILAHRFFWCFFFTIWLVWVKKQGGAFKTVAFSLEKMRIFILTAILLSINWGVYIWATINNHIVETSMGYFINPLVSIFLGRLVLKEKSGFWEIIAIFLAASGVLYLVFQYGEVPWIALTLAFSFGLYGLLRKIAPANSLIGLTVETAVMVPLSFVYILFQGIKGEGAFFLAGPWVTFLLVAAGVLTALPLLWLVHGAKRLPLKTMGFCQYLAPSLILLIGVIVFREPFTFAHRVSFGLIWSALAVYSLSNSSILKRFRFLGCDEKFSER